MKNCTIRTRTTILSCTMLIFCNSLWAQPGNTGMRFSQYGGTMSTYENPAMGVSSHTKWELQLFNFNEMMENDLIKLNLSNVINKGQFGNTDGKIMNQQSPLNKEFSFRNVLEVQGPAVFFNYKKKYAFGINTRTRFFFQMREVNLDLANAALGDANFDLQTYGPITEDFMNLNLNLITDIGLTASAEVLKIKKHTLYAGASLRFYKGIAAIDFTAQNINIDPDKIVNADSVVQFSADMQFNSSLPADFDLLASNGDDLNFGSIMSNAFNKSAGSGIGGDIGAVYQGSVLNHSIRASLSVTDIGSIKYNKGAQTNARFVANNVSIPIDSFDNFPRGYDSIKQWAASYGVGVDTSQESFVQGLPTRLNLYAEAQITRGFYVGMATSSNLSTARNKSSSYSSYTAIIPRWQSNMLEVWAPISYNYFSNNLKAGLGVRLAFLYLGTDDLLSLASGAAKSINFYVGFRIAGNFSKKKIKKADD